MKKLEVEAEAIVASRLQARQSVKLLEPYLDAGLIGGKETEEANETDVFKLDYLAPFLPKCRKLTREQAIETRDACLKVGPFMPICFENLANFVR